MRTNTNNLGRMKLCKYITYEVKQNPTMKHFLHKKGFHTGAVQIHVEPPPITWMKSKNDRKAEIYSEKIKSCRDLTSDKSDLYEFKMALFNNGRLEEFLLFSWNFIMALDTSEMIAANTKL